jgi:cystathionine gamma-synthase
VPDPVYTRRTLAAQAMGSVDAATRALVPPIHVATTFIRDPDNQYRSGNSYARPDNATVREAEAIVAMLEGAAAALVLGSGMSAATCVFLALAPGDHVVAPKVMYWGLRNWLLNDARGLGLEVELVDTADVAAVRAAIRPGATRLVWLETPANPLWTITDLAAVCEIAHAAGARVAVDSTCATPVLTRPIQLGADIVMHAATKYLNGHSDVVAGALATAHTDEFWDRLRRIRTMLGMILGPMEAHLLIRGMRTLHLRVAQACTTAMELARRLQRHPAVIEVLYPGLPSHPGHATAAHQMRDFGGMVSFLASSEEEAVAFCARTKLFLLAESLGGVESLIELPARMTHASPAGAPFAPPPNLVRLSVGIESADDLVADLEAALAGRAVPVPAAGV